MTMPYLTLNYLQKKRWISYWYQIKEAASLKNVHSVLEVGSGNKIVADTLFKIGYEVKTLDSNSKTRPDFLIDIIQSKGLPPEMFDLVLCCQVLEHLPYSSFALALENLYSLTKEYLLISLPYTSRGTFKPYFNVHLFPFLKPMSWVKIFNFFPRPHTFNGQHYWEIGKKGYPLKKILRDVERIGFKIVKNYPVPENPYHYLILCQKRPCGQSLC